MFSRSFSVLRKEAREILRDPFSLEDLFVTFIEMEENRQNTPQGATA